jgi:murein DD-endopeptidase MepM/ murein hydrolase activator NlpD
MLSAAGSPRAHPPGEPRRRLPRRLGGLAAALLCLAGSVLAVESTSTHPASATIGSDKSRIIQIEQEIEHEGSVVQALVTQANLVRAHLIVVQGQIATDQQQLAADRRSYDAASARLTEVAVQAYVEGGSVAGNFADSSDVTTSLEQGVYAGIADGTLGEAMNTTQLAERQLNDVEGALHAAEKSLAATLSQLDTAQQQAQSAISQDEQILSQVKGNLLKLVLQAAARAEQAKEEAEEAAEAAQEAKDAQPPPPVTTTPPASTPPASTPPTTTTSNPGPVSSAGYADPLRAISALSPERVDQGVDYSGYGPIYAVGDGVVICTVNAGWPGGTFIVYQLTDGPAAGLYAYAAEDIDPEVSPGESVTPNTVLGQMYEGPDGIETGWADGSALGETMAAAEGQFDGDNSTAFGYNFSQLLESVGAPGGILQNDPPSGSLPANWPQW